MKIDIVFVCYNSKKWLRPNLESILKSDYDLKNNISLLYFDNASTDDTLDELKALKKEHASSFRNFKIIEGKENYGFGVGNNCGASYGDSEYIFFLNTDTEIFPDTLTLIEKEIKKAGKDYSIFELKQLPYEHPKYYNPANGEVSWASGACLLFRRKVFEKLKGFDPNLFMYCEDVELSWRARSRGFKIRYLWNVPVMHYSYATPGEFKETQYVYSYVNNFYLRCKYGNIKKVVKGFYYFLKGVKARASLSLSRKECTRISFRLLKEFAAMTPAYARALVYRLTHRFAGDFEPAFYDPLDYEAVNINPFLDRANLPKPCRMPLVSVIVRTHARPNVLRETLVSIRNQTYPNIETIVVEDGENTAESMIRKEFADMNIRYHATMDHVGRSAVGNLGMEMAKGEYLKFLDDDDLFFPNHVERLVTEAVNHDYDIVYDTAYETSIKILSEDPYKYIITNMKMRYHGDYSQLKLIEGNLFPIQVVMFKKAVYEKCGGFDEQMDALEDWDLWLRYSFDYRYHYVKDTTSLYRTPAGAKAYSDRIAVLNDSLNYIVEKHADKKLNVEFADIFFHKNEL